MQTSPMRWRKAITTSLLFHLFFIAISGYLGANFFAIPAEPEQVIELDFTNGLQVEHSGVNTPVSQTTQVPTSLVASASVTQQAATAPVATGDISMISTETPAASAEHETNNSTPSSPPSSSSNVVGNPGSSDKRGIVVPPSILSNSDPVYPPSARQASLEGTVVLKIQILENGRPGNITVFQSSGHEILDGAAINAVRQWRFIPAKDRHSGRAIISYSTMPVSFHLK